MAEKALLKIEGLSRLQVGPVDLLLSAGECMTLAGPSGAGKSMLLRSIADLDPHQGSVFLAGKGCRDFRPHEWRQHVALLPAEPAWWGEHIGDHFSSFDPELFEALGFVESVLGWEVANCSTGERQRLALLRLLQNRPRVLLLDEPTAGLDRDNTLRVEALVQRYREKEGAAVIWVSHDPEQVHRLTGRHLFIVKGQLEEVQGS